MRLICSQKDLSSALNISSKAVGANSTLPVLNNVLLKAEGKKLFFTTTNLEIAVHYWIDAEVKNEGETTLPSKLITSYVSYLKDEKVNLQVGEGESVLLETSDSKTKIKGIPASEFPSIPNVEKEGYFKVGAQEFEKAIQQVVFASALNTTRPILTGVYFNLNKNELRMAATDSYRLAEKTLPVKESEGDISCIIPSKTILELGSILSFTKPEGEIEGIVSKNQVLFSFNKIKITSRLIEGQFPNYQQVIPKETKTKIKLNNSELSLALKRINLFAKENNNKILLKVNSDRVLITTDTTQYGAGEIEIKTKTEGAENEIALNSQFLLDVLSNIGSGDIWLELGEKTNPATLKPADKNDYIHIIMPLKI